MTVCDSRGVPEYELEAWVAVVQGLLAPPSPDYIVVMFPSHEVREAYLSTITERPENEVRSVLRTFLGDSRTVDLTDRLHFDFLRARQRRITEGDIPDLRADFSFTEYDRRVIGHFAGKSMTPTWEGITWVLDLLPHFPQHALQAVHAYLLGHAQVLPDLRISGLADAADLIRSRYVTHGSASVEVLQEVLLELSPRDFEFLLHTFTDARGMTWK